MTLLESNTQRNHAEIAAHVTPFNRLFQSGAASLLWNPATAAGRAALDGTIAQQALAIAYIDDFKLMMVVSLASLPLLLLFRRPKRMAVAEHGAVME
jgi:DHA2 family multidrug resistance protein